MHTYIMCHLYKGYLYVYTNLCASVCAHLHTVMRTHTHVHAFAHTNAYVSAHAHTIIMCSTTCPHQGRRHGNHAHRQKTCSLRPCQLQCNIGRVIARRAFGPMTCRGPA